jgi:hypothetical protein
MKVIGRDVYTAIGVDPAQQLIKSGANEGQPYYRARYDGKGFTVTEAFFEAWNAGEIVEVNLSESSYLVEDAQNPGQMIPRQSWQLTAFGTVNQIEKVVANENKLRLLNAQTDVQIKKLEAEVVGKLDINEEFIKQLKAAL